jgi:hypothetical protein
MNPAPQHTIESLTESHNRLYSILEQLVQQMNTNATTPVRVDANVAALSKNPMKDPEPFKGDTKDIRCFLAYFTMWASLQDTPLMNAGRRDDKAWVASALSYFRGNAAHWAQLYLQQIFEHDMATAENKSLHPLPFNSSTWVDFVKAVETRFRPGDDQEIAQQEMDVLKQG